jgi:hypothetical protein
MAREDLPTTILIYYLRHLFSDMKAGFKDLLFYPDTFFKAIAQEKVNLIPPAIIVAGGCAISILGWLVPFGVYVITRQLTGNPFDLTYLGYGVVWYLVWYQVKCYILWPFLGWILVSGILYLISRLFSKDGSFPAILQNAGYGLVPWAISNAASVVATTLLITRPDLHTNLLLNPGTVNAIIFYLFMIWCCCLWVYAIKHTCRIPVQRAVAVVVLVVIVIFIPVYLAAYFPFSF